MSLLARLLGEHEERRMKVCLLGGIALWFVVLNTVYALPSLACKWDWFPFSVGPLSGLQVVQAMITLAAALLMGVLIYLPFQNWREYQTQQPPGNPHMLQDTEKGRQPLFAFIVMMANSFFLLFVVALFVPIFALRPCG